MSLADSIEHIDHCLTAPELAQILKVHKLTIYRQARAGVLPSFRVASCIRFDPKAVAQKLRERGVL